MVDVLFPGSDGPSSEPPRCSAKGCRRPAEIDLRWRNPKLHDEARVKHWLACPEHADSLADYLGVRGFLLQRVPLQTESLEGGALEGGEP